MEISVVVCTKNEEEYLENCLKCLLTQEVKPEIIVIDNHSKDKTLKIARKYADKLLFDDNGGLGLARDIAITSAKGDIIAFCDADARPNRNWTKTILEEIKNYSAVSGPLSCYDGDKNMNRDFNIWANFLPRVMGKFGYHNLWGANMAFKRETLEKYKFKVKFLEDYNMSRQLRRNKEKVKFTKNITLSVSCRRFREKGFVRTCVKYYVLTFFKMHLTKNQDFRGYY